MGVGHSTGYDFVAVIADGATWVGLLPSRRQVLGSHLVGKMAMDGGCRAWENVR